LKSLCHGAKMMRTSERRCRLPGARRIKHQAWLTRPRRKSRLWRLRGILFSRRFAMQQLDLFRSFRLFYATLRTYGPITIAIRARFEYDSSAIQHPTRSYVLSSNNEHVNSFALLYDVVANQRSRGGASIYIMT